jgi:hypothetical protein
MSEHFLGSNKAFEILANLGLDPLSMPGYIKKKFQEYEHVAGNKRQTCLYSPKPKKFGT